METIKDDKSYEKVNTNTYFQSPTAVIFKQLFVVSGAWTAYFLNGLAFGIPTVMIPQIRKAATSKDAVSTEMASWLSSVFSYAAIPWVVIICIATRYFGRKIPFIIVCFNMFVYFNLLYFSTTLNHVLIAEIMQGVTHGSHVSLTPMIVTEYIDPKYRGLFATIKTANFYWGVWIANAIGTYYPWKYIPLVGIFTSLTYLTILFWPESPQWLASIGEFEKCRTEHRWLRGTHAQAEKELEQLIQSQMNCRKNERITKESHIKRALRIICIKSFYKPTWIGIVLMTLYVVTGKMAIAMYAIDIIKTITANESAAYTGMLIMDGITIVGMYTGCVLTKLCNRRTVLFFGCFSGIAFLVIISVYLFLTDSGIIVENKIVSLALLTLFSLCISSGLLVLTSTIVHELIPLRYKCSVTTLSALFFSAESGTMMKLYPTINATFRMSGTFMMHAILTTVCGILLYIYLPETKDKTLQEIEDIIKGEKKISEEKEPFPLE